MNRFKPARLLRQTLTLLLPACLLASTAYLSAEKLSPPDTQAAHTLSKEAIALEQNRPPPISNEQQQQISQFISSYFSALESNDLEALLAHYAEQVQYYEWGIIDKLIVSNDKADYFERWPLIKQQLLGEIETFSTEQANETLVVYLFEFEVQNPQPESGPGKINGKARHTWRLQQQEDGTLKIVAEKQRVLKRQRSYE